MLRRVPNLKFPEFHRGYGESPPMPRPGDVAPHKDLAQLVCGFTSSLKGIGKSICSTLDTPFEQTVGIDGPHRLVDSILDVPADVVHEILRKEV